MSAPIPKIYHRKPSIVDPMGNFAQKLFNVYNSVMGPRLSMLGMFDRAVDDVLHTPLTFVSFGTNIPQLKGVVYVPLMDPESIRYYRMEETLAGKILSGNISGIEALKKNFE